MPEKKRRLSESAPTAAIEAQASSFTKPLKSGLGFDSRPEHENPLCSLYDDSLLYRAHSTTERKIILAEDEKNPVAPLGAEDEWSLEKCTLVLSDRVSHRK